MQGKANIVLGAADRCTAPAHQGRKMPQRVLQQRLPSPVAPGLLPRRTSQGSRPTFRVRVAPLTIVKHPNRLQPTFRSLRRQVGEGAEGRPECACEWVTDRPHLMQLEILTNPYPTSFTARSLNLEWHTSSS